MQSERNYWITTAGEGFPNSRPVWGIWKSPILWFSTGGSIARRVASDSRVQVTLESADELVIIEGHAAPLAEEDAAEWASEYNQKYNWDMPESTQGVYRVEPQRVPAGIRPGHRMIPATRKPASVVHNFIPRSGAGLPKDRRDPFP